MRSSAATRVGPRTYRSCSVSQQGKSWRAPGPRFLSSPLLSSPLLSSPLLSPRRSLPRQRGRERRIGITASVCAFALVLAGVTLAGRAAAGPNAGGVLFLAADTTAVVDSSYCGATPLPACSLSVVSLPMWNPTTTVFRVWAAFPPDSSPRLKGLTFGLRYDPAKVVLLNYGTCGDFELPGPGWPGTGTGTSMLWDAAQTSNPVEAYWFQGYAYSYVDGDTTSLALTPHPDQGGYFVDDAKPGALDPIAAYGAIGFGTVGKLPCPVDQGGQDGVQWIHQSQPGSGQPPDTSGTLPPDLPPSNAVDLVLPPGVMQFNPNEADPVAIGSVQFGNSTLRSVLIGGNAETIQKSFPGGTPADTTATTADGQQVRIPDLSGFYEVKFASPADAQACTPLLRDLSSVTLADLVPERHYVVSAPNDPFYDDFCVWPHDAQWFLRNDGYRQLAYCTNSVSGQDIGAEYAWQQAGGYGDSTVVIGEVDTGILGGMAQGPSHPDLRVIPLSEDERRLIDTNPGVDWCDAHGTVMAGIAAAKTNNSLGVAGVCGGCSLLDIDVSTCDSLACTLHQNCIYPSAEYYKYLGAALQVQLPYSAAVRVFDMPFSTPGSAGHAEVAALWTVYLQGVALVAASDDSSFTAPAYYTPAHIPFVCGAGGSTWAGLFFDSSTSCYRPKRHGTAAGSMIHLCAPASGEFPSTYPTSGACSDPGNGDGLYYGTEGLCSGAAAQTAGAIGLLQSMAVRHWGQGLPADAVVGILETTAVPFAGDPKLTDPCTSCPRFEYGRGILNVGAAAEVVRNLTNRGTIRACYARKSGGDIVPGTWSYVAIDSFTVQGQPWYEFKASAEVTYSYHSWVRRAGTDCVTNTFASCCRDPYDRIYLATMKAPVHDCHYDMDASGNLIIVGYDYAQKLPTGQLQYLVGEDNVVMQYDAIWEPVAVADSSRLSTGSDVRLARPACPARPPIALRYWTEGRGAVEARVVDAAGRVVWERRLDQGPRGWQGLSWDGRDGRGRPVAAGVYWVQARSGRARPSERLVVLR